MNEGVNLILSLSFSGSILAIILFVIKSLIKNKLSKSIQYYIWIVVLLRLVIPFSLENSLMNNVFYGEENVGTIVYEDNGISRSNDNNEINGTDYVVGNNVSIGINANDESIESIESNEIIAADGSNDSAQTIDSLEGNSLRTLITESTEENRTKKEYISDVNHSPYIRNIINKYALNIWFVGVILAITLNLVGYIGFMKHLEKGNKLASDAENKLLLDILKERKRFKCLKRLQNIKLYKEYEKNRSRITLFRNTYVTTPMLIGIFRPRIIIPDADYNEKQIRNILIHEITHYRRFDIGVKWLTMIVTSIHWFNPIIYFMKKEINRACELACDEEVIKNLDVAEKQEYGNTLIAVVAENKFSFGVLGATMCEEKKDLKERLVAIMEHNKKSKAVILASIILLIFIIGVSVSLGAGVGKGSKNPLNIQANAQNLKNPPNIYISAEYEETKTALMGGYSWENNGEVTLADSLNPVDFKYELDNIVSVDSKEQIIISTQKLNKDIKYDFDLAGVTIYNNGEVVEVESLQPSFMNGELYIGTPEEAGEYIYDFTLIFKDKGTVTYGFVVRVEMNEENQKTEIYDNEEYYSKEVIDLVEDNLKIIMSSPKVSSKPQDYMDKHQEEYENIIKYSYSYENDEVLEYMLFQFEKGNVEGLRGQILMSLCKELLGARNTVVDETLSPMKWYHKLEVGKEIMLPDFTYNGADSTLKLVYDTEIEQNKNYNTEGFTIVSPHIIGSYEEENKLKVFVITCTARYRLYDKVIEEESESMGPVAITYIKNSDGSYSLEEYQQPMDGAYLKKSIEEFCIMPVSGKNIEGLAEKILEGDGVDAERIRENLQENLIKHLEIHNQYGVSLYKENYQEIADLIPLTPDIMQESQSMDKFSVEERKRIELYVEVMKEAFQIENGGDGFIAVQVDTLEDLSDEGKTEVLKELTILTPSVFNYEDIKDDKTKFEYEDNGGLERTLDGTLLSVEVKKYSANKAEINGVSWFGSLGAVFPEYNANYVEGKWKLEMIRCGIS
ncbi:M56 family metallopeptidase [Clostridium sp. DL1XJH146]